MYPNFNFIFLASKHTIGLSKSAKSSCSVPVVQVKQWHKARTVDELKTGREKLQLIRFISDQQPGCGQFPAGSRGTCLLHLFQIKSQQSEVTRVLDGKNIKYELVDISQDNALREEMRTRSGNPKAIPPQIFNGDHYCGDYELFVEAVEQNTLQEFLKLA
nr:SH3 domain-binding glutamic acid-rich-like protein 3 [Pelodiscus sinensis]|eukprot:XP_014426929.1 SH3 domain-binding glutamic acid-rich-like protein 3 [Pelodiscus sinensis]